MSQPASKRWLVGDELLHLEMLRVLLLLASMSVPGCAMYASATASHSGITPCVDDRTFMLVDVVGATVTGAIVVASDGPAESLWSLTLPGLFALSAILGGIEVHYCNQRATPIVSEEPKGKVIYKSGNMPDQSPKQSQDQVPVQPPQPLERSTDPLRLPANFKIQESKTPIECTLATKDRCPPNHVCVIIGDEIGVCQSGK